MPSKRGRMNGEGSIYFRASDSKWCASLTLANGKRKVLYGDTSDDVRRQLAKAVRERDQGITAQSDDRLTVAAYLAGWLERGTPRWRASTHERYAEQVAHVSAALGKTRLLKLSAAQVERLYAQLLESGLSGSSVAHLHTCLKSALKDAVRKRILAVNVCEMVTPPRAAHAEIHPLDETQANAFLLASRGERQEALFILALRTGMRQGELCALAWQDVNMERGTLLVRRSVRARKGGGYEFMPPKTKAGKRTITLKPAVIEALKGHRARQAEERLFLGAAWQDNGLVFPSTIGTPQEVHNLSRTILRRIVERASLPRIRFHDLRHTCATLMLSHGTDAKTVSDLLGHANIAITLGTYGHVLPNMRERAADIMDAILAPSTAV
jgi:integrase